MSLIIRHLSQFPDRFYPLALKLIYQNSSELLKLAPRASISVNWSEIIRERSAFSSEQREILVSELKSQYGDLADGQVLENIEALSDSDTFTITTGQQIHIMLGPLYVLYKIATVLNKAESLAKSFPDKRFVPIFWMASEDHDFEEINHFSLFGKRYEWNAASGGPVGRLPVTGVTDLLTQVMSDFEHDPNVMEVLRKFSRFYQSSDNLSEATRKLLHHFFGDRGLVVINPDSAVFKVQFSHVMAEDIRTDNFNKLLTSQSEFLKHLGIKGIVSPRNTNLFYLANTGRKRIIAENDGYRIGDDGELLSKKEIIEKLDTQPQNFSPNVTLRPLYQELILPNLAYIAGPTEFIYWLQIYPLFSQIQLTNPALLLRNSVVFTDKKSTEWLENKGFDILMMINSLEGVKNQFITLTESRNTLPGLSSDLELLIDEINRNLYEQKSPGLKDLKRHSDLYIKELRKEIKKNNETLLTTGTSGEDWKKTFKIYQKYFNPEFPQERSQFFIEKIIQDPAILNDIRDLPESELHPLSVCYKG